MKQGRGLVHAALRRHPAGAVDRLSGLFATALLCLSLPAVGELSSPASAVVWYVDHRNLVQIDPKTDQPVISVGLPSASDALAVDPADGSVWVLAKRQLLKFDRTGGITQTIDLRALSGRFDEPGQLVLNPHDRSLWITGERGIVLLDSGGKLTGETSLPEHIQSAALDLDGHLWVVTEKQLHRLAPDLTIRPSQSLRSITAAPRHIAVDRLGERLWLAGRRELVAIDTATGQPVTRISHEAALGGRGHGSDVDALAVHPVFGTVWVAVRQNLLVYDRQGQVLKEIALTPFDLGEVEAMAFDPVEFGLWLGGKKALGHFRSNGEFVGRVPVQSELEALATATFRLRPTLRLLAPADRTVTRNAYAPLRYGLGSDCTGTPCYLSTDYTRSFSLSVDVDGQAHGPLFVLSPDEAVLTPLTRWPEGGHRVTAEATDRYGHRSGKVESRFTVDTIAPRFLTVTPADGSSALTGAVTIQGSVDEPGASVFLHDKNGMMVSGAASQFSFSVVLQPGWNVFGLLARDPAGNETSVPLRLYLNALDATLTTVTPGSTVSTDRLTVAGTFIGPENTGITVNGIPAFTDGQNFYINNLPLDSGQNTLTIVVTGPDGQVTTKTVTVSSSGPSPLQVDVEPRVGIAPHTSRFRIGYGGSGTVTVTRYTLDVDGDGVVDDSGSDISTTLVYVYPLPGVYRPRVTITDSTGRTYDQIVTVLVQDPARVDEFFGRLWSGLNGALASGNLPAALGYLNASARDKYRPVFETLRADLPQIVATFSPPARLSAGESLAEYAISRPYQGRERVYLINFLKDADGVWRLDEM